MEPDKISVIVPVYKVEPYLRKCLDSIVNQTYHNLEIILVDDGSPDNCGAICDEYALQDSRIVVIHQQNAGAFAARNTALNHATGDLIGFVDADDWIEREFYYVLAEMLYKYHADIAQCEMVNDGPYAQTRSIKMGKTCVYSSAEYTAAMFREEINHSIWSKLFRRNMWQDLRFPEGVYHADATAVVEFASRCSCLVRIDRQLYHYNTSNTSITRGQKTFCHIVSMERLFRVFDRAAADAAEEGSFFICREIPSRGCLILPGAQVTIKQAWNHVRYMHSIFRRHWDAARKSSAYKRETIAKRFLWHMYAVAPITASLLVAIYHRGKDSL